MARSKGTHAWAEQLADLEDPAPKDFDPEGHGETLDDTDSASYVSEAVDPTEHYVDVGKSKLRNQDPLSLGPQYEGSRINREALLADDSDDDPFGSGASQKDQSKQSEVDDPEDIDAIDQEGEGDEKITSDEAFRSGDSTKYKSSTFQGSRDSRVAGQDQHPRSAQREDLGSSADDSEDDEAITLHGHKKVEDYSIVSDDDQETISEDIANAEASQEDISKSESAHDSTDENLDGEPARKDNGSDDRATLRQIMAEEQKSVVATISQAAKADVEKGRAVKQQRVAFDALLNTRIRLQKALIATNSMCASQNTNHTTSDDAQAIRAAEQAALNLWNTLDSLRTSLSTTTTNKRPFSATLATSTSDLASRMQSQESASLPHRRSILTKWSHKIYPNATLPTRNKLNNTLTQQPLTTLLDAQLSVSNIQRLIKRTQIPRSCAPLQAQSGLEDDQIYDDADFYTLLLRELVDQRMTSSTTNVSNTATPNIAALPAITRRDAKIKKKVDTKASKGRKMRYTVHEKLQNFMAPEDRGTWGERQVDELFGSLLGRRIELAEEDGGEDGEEGEDGMEEGLRLFGGA